MPLQDLWKRNRDRLAKFLSDAVRTLSGPEPPETKHAYWKKINDLAEIHYEWNFDQLLEEAPETIAERIQAGDTPLYENLEQLADLFAVRSGQEPGMIRNRIYAQKALDIYAFITQKTATFSFERDAKEKSLKKSHTP